MKSNYGQQDAALGYSEWVATGKGDTICLIVTHLRPPRIYTYLVLLKERNKKCLSTRKTMLAKNMEAFVAFLVYFVGWHLSLMSVYFRLAGLTSSINRRNCILEWWHVYPSTMIYPFSKPYLDKSNGASITCHGPPYDGEYFFNPSWKSYYFSTVQWTLENVAC